MQANKLTLYGTPTPARANAYGVVIALRSYVRWCSVTSNSPAATARSSACCSPLMLAIDHRLVGDHRISGEMVRDLMIACVDALCASRTPYPVDGCPITLCLHRQDTLYTATALRLPLCFTPVLSP